MDRKQKGFGIVEVTIILAVAAGLVALGWYIWQGQQQKQNGGQTTNVSRDYSDPCGIFTKSEVEDAFGVPFGDFKDENIEEIDEVEGAPDISICKTSQTRESAGNSVGAGVSVIIEIQGYKTLAAAQTEIELTRALADYGEPPEYILTEAAGMADEAFFYEGREAADQVTLYVRQGKTVFKLTALRLDGLDSGVAKEQLRQLADGAF